MSGAHHLPVKVGGRPLVAKSCSRCGQLLSGSNFARMRGNRSNFTYRPWCRDCDRARLALARQERRGQQPARSVVTGSLRVGRLISMTCSGCGALRDASEFYIRHEDNTYARPCKTCACAAGPPTSEENSRQYQRQQADTRPHAIRNGYTWTGPELEIAGRNDLSIREIALMLGRTHAAVRLARYKLNKPQPREVALAGVGGVR